MVAVYLLMAVNYQSWGDPFVVLAALPLAFCGIVISLFVTQTTFSIPSLLGAIMSVGVASANSILLVTFAREHREETGASAVEAAIEAGADAAAAGADDGGAMFVGLIPMAHRHRRGERAERRPRPRRAGRRRGRNLFDPAVRAVPLFRAAPGRGQEAGGLRMNDASPAVEQRTRPRPPRKGLYFAVAGVLLALLAWGAYVHWQRDADAAETTRQAADFVPTVRVAEAKRVDAPVTMTLPGQTQPFDSASIYARATGYIAERLVDIGTRVRKGDPMLRVSAPDLDAQLAQASRPARPAGGGRAAGAGTAAAGPGQREPGERHQPPHQHARRRGLGDPAERRQYRANVNTSAANVDLGDRRHRGRRSQPQGPGRHRPAIAGADRLRTHRRPVRWRRHRPQHRCRRSRHRRRRRQQRLC